MSWGPKPPFHLASARIQNAPVSPSPPVSGLHSSWGILSLFLPQCLCADEPLLLGQSVLLLLGGQLQGQALTEREPSHVADCEGRGDAF